MTKIIGLASYQPDNAVSADGALKSAMGKLKQVLVLGYEADGTLLVSSNTLDKGTLIFMVEDFKMRLLNGEFDEY